MSESLIKTSIFAFAWSAVEKTLRFAFRFGISVILARILDPEDYGLIAMVTIFMSLDHALVESGFMSALIQKKDIDDEDLSSVFWFNLAMSFVMYAVLYVLAPLIARFYGKDILTDIVRVLAIVPIISAFSIVQNVQLMRKLDFKKITIIAFVSSVISGAIAIFMAYRGYGVWSLVAQRILLQLFTVLTMILLLRWFPMLGFNYKKIRELFRFSSKLLLSYLLQAVFNNAYNVLIGKIYSARDLGFYNRGWNLKQLPVTNLSTIIQQVVFPLFSKIQDDRQKIKTGTRMIIEVSSFMIIPLMLIMAASGKALFFVLFGEKWLPSVPYFQILAVGGLFYIMSIVNLNILLSLGHAGRYLLFELLKKILILLSLLGLFWGLKGLVIGAASVGIAEFFINASRTNRLIQYSIPQQLADALPYFLSSLPPVLLVLLISRLPYSFLIILLLQLVCGIGMYLLITFIFRLNALHEVKMVFQTLRNKHKPQSDIMQDNDI